MANFPKALLSRIIRRQNLSATPRRISNIISADCSTDYERWREVRCTTGDWNPSRAKRIAAIIPDGVHILDLGAGSMVLKDHIKTYCKYTPADVHDRGEGCIVVDLNTYEFPDGHYDWVTMIGLLEYLKDPRWVLARAAQAAPKVVISYNSTNAVPDLRVRQNMGWICHLSEDELICVVQQAGLAKTELVGVPSEGEITIFCERGDTIPKASLVNGVVPVH